MKINSIKSYYDKTCANWDIPKDTAIKTLKSTVLSFGVTFVMSGGRVPFSLLMGGTAAIASLIHGLTSPLFMKLFNSDDKINNYQQIARMYVNLVLTQLLINSCTVYRVNIIGVTGLMAIALSILGGGNENSLIKNATYVLIPFKH